MKYFVKQINPEFQSYLAFYDSVSCEHNFQEAYPGLIFNPQVQHTNVHGPIYNNNYGTLASELYNHIDHNLELAFCDWGELDTDQQTMEELQRILDFYKFDPFNYRDLDDFQHWTEEDLEIWEAIFNGNNCADYDVVVMSVLQLMTGHKWGSRCLNGNCQSDWVYVLYDTTIWTDEALENFRVSYWNLGSEWEFHYDYSDLAANTQYRSVTPEDISGYTAYCPMECPTNEELKAWAAGVIDLPDCKPEDVVLFKFKGQRRIDEYTEV